MADPRCLEKRHEWLGFNWSVVPWDNFSISPRVPWKPRKPHLIYLSSKLWVIYMQILNLSNGKILEFGVLTFALFKRYSIILTAVMKMFNLSWTLPHLLIQGSKSCFYITLMEMSAKQYKTKCLFYLFTHYASSKGCTGRWWRNVNLWVEVSFIKNR